MNTDRKSLQKIFDGFSKISKTEQTEYLKYLDLVIERRENLAEINRLIRFKNRLEKSMKNPLKPLQSLEKEAV